MELVLLPVFSISDSFGIEIAWMIHELSFWEDIVLELGLNRDCVINILLPSVTCFPVSKQSKFRIVLLS
jgi:hypothetical protein